MYTSAYEAQSTHSTVTRNQHTQNAALYITLPTAQTWGGVESGKK